MRWCGFPLGLLVLLLGSACNTGPTRSDDAVDPRIYRNCQDPEARDAWQRAQATIASGRDEAAMPDLLVVVSRCPDLVRAHIAYQDAARRIGGTVAQAMADFYRQLPDGASPVPAYMRARLADTSYAQSNALDAILAKDSSFAWAHLSQARINRREGRLLPALDMYASAIVNDRELVEARFERAQVLAELGRDEEAAVEYKTYLAGRPDDVAAMRAYVNLLLYRLNRIDEALTVLDRLEAAEPGSMVLRMDRAAALWRAKRLREAVQAYVAILHDAPDTARAALNVGLLYYEIVPQNEAERRLYWPKARAAFQWFLLHSKPTDGHEQFERTLAVPYRLDRITDLIGVANDDLPQIIDLQWPRS